MSGQPSWANGFVAVDWGTTNRRAYRVGPDGRCLDELEDGRGILSVERGQFERELGRIRSRLGNGPLLLAGMVGSNRGWVETDYVPCPAGIGALAGNLVRAAGHAFIVPGLSFSDGRSDVMRGEEVQILGAVESKEIPGDCFVCHPGTHNKWVVVSGGRIASFRTVMTGELFNLLKERSILSGLLDSPSAIGEAFCDGVRTGLSGTGLGSVLFEVRARFLLGKLDGKDGASFVSGLLIGDDVRCGLADRDGDLPVFVMGRPDLTGLYSEALDVCGVSCSQVDGEQSFLAGARAIVERIA